MVKRTLIHLSDLHIGRREIESKRVKKVFNKIAESYPGLPILITGDLTDSATKGQFEKTRGFLDALAKTNPILSVPGNHDYAWKGNWLRPDGWENWVKHLGSPLGWKRDEIHWLGINNEPEGVDGLGIWEHGSCVFIGIDSGDPGGKVASARGYISKGLADALKKTLEKHSNKTRIALIHHHPFTDGFFTELKGSKILMDALKGNCELFLFGHEHAYGIWWGKKGIPLIVSSHKTTNVMSGDCLMITVIGITNPGKKDASFSHRLEVL